MGGRPAHSRKSCVLCETVLQSEFEALKGPEGLETRTGHLLELTVNISVDIAFSIE